MRSYFCIKNLRYLFFILLIENINAKPLRLICSLEECEKERIEYINNENVMPDSFIIDSINVYIAKTTGHYAMYIWNYREPFSTNNPILINNYAARSIKRYSNIIVNIGLQIYNKNNDEILNIFDYDVTLFRLSENETHNIKFAINDSIIYYFSTYDRFHDNLMFNSYNIRKRKKEALVLDTLNDILKNNYPHIYDVFVNKDKLYILYDEYNGIIRQQYVACWDIKSNEQLKRNNIDSIINGKILGIDKNDNIFVYTEGNDEYRYPLFIYNSNLDTVASTDIYPLIKAMPFMDGNYLLPSDAENETLIVGYMNENSQLFFMAKTKKGLYFVEFDYLPLLRK